MSSLEATITNPFCSKHVMFGAVLVAIVAWYSQPRVREASGPDISLNSEENQTPQQQEDTCEEFHVPENSKLIKCSEFEDENGHISVCKYECKHGYFPKRGQPEIGMSMCKSSERVWKAQPFNCFDSTGCVTPYSNDDSFELLDATSKKLIQKTPELRRPILGRLSESQITEWKALIPQISHLLPELAASPTEGDESNGNVRTNKPTSDGDGGGYSSGGIFRDSVESIALHLGNAPEMICWLCRLTTSITGRRVKIPEDKQRGWQPIWYLRYHPGGLAIPHTDFTVRENQDEHLTVVLSWMNFTEGKTTEGGSLYIPNAEDPNSVEVPCKMGNFAAFHGGEWHHVQKISSNIRYSVSASFQYA